MPDGTRLRVRRNARRWVSIASSGTTLRRRQHADLARAISLPRRAMSAAERAWTDRIETRRAELCSSTVPLGANTVGMVAGTASKRPSEARMLMRLVRELKAESVLEMGSALGISACYLAAGLRLNGGGRLITLEGNPQRCQLAEESLVLLGLDDVAEARVGRFADTYVPALAELAPIDLVFMDGNHQALPTLDYVASALAHLAPGGVIVFDDIRWSDEMFEAWTRLRTEPAAELAVDLGGMGLLRFPRGSSGSADLPIRSSPPAP